MCRHFLILDEQGRMDKNKYAILKAYVINSYNLGNRDGYFLRIDGIFQRTLDIDGYLDFIEEYKEKIMSAKVIHGHLRLATTHEKTKKGVHGWLINKYFCSHNGIVENKLKEGVDSLSFFKMVFKNKKKDLLRKLKDELENHSGGGSFYMTSIDGKKFLIASKNKPNNIHLINGYLLVINSNDDIHRFKKLKIVKKKYIERYGIYFYKTTTEKIDLDIDIREDLSRRNEDEAIYYDGEKTYFIDIDTSSIYDRYYEYPFYKR